MNVIIYARVSTDQQADAGTVDQQVKYLRSYCAKSEEKYKAVGSLVDDGVSGADEERARNLVQAVKDFKAQGYQVDALIVTQLDRLARDLFQGLWIEKELAKINVAILFAKTESLNSTDLFAKAMRQIAGVFAELDKKQIEHRLSGGIVAREMQGIANGQRRFGYRKGEDAQGYATWELDPVEAPIVQKLFLAASRLTLTRKISRNLAFYAMQSLTPEEIGTLRNRFSSTQGINWMLRNPFYCGVFKARCKGGGFMQGTHPVIIKLEGFIALWDRLSKSSGKKGMKHLPPLEKLKILI